MLKEGDKMNLDPNRFSSDFVNVKEIGCLTLDFIGSDKLKELFESAECGETKEFQNGARWGMAMLMVYLGAEATHFYSDLNRSTEK